LIWPGRGRPGRIFSGAQVHVFRMVLNSRRFLAVQRLKNCTCGTVPPFVAGGFRVGRFDLGFEGRLAFRSITASRPPRRGCLFRISPSSLLLSSISLCPSVPATVAASESLSAPVTTSLTATRSTSQKLGHAGVYARSPARRFRYVCNGFGGVCWPPPFSPLRLPRNLVCPRPLARA
jgi:hypothetical protein